MSRRPSPTASGHLGIDLVFVVTKNLTCWISFLPLNLPPKMFQPELLWIEISYSSYRHCFDFGDDGW